MKETPRDPQAEAYRALIRSVAKFSQTLADAQQINADAVTASQNVEKQIVDFRDTHTRKHTLGEAAGDLIHEGYHTAQQRIQSAQKEAKSIAQEGLALAHDTAQDIATPLTLTLAASVIAVGTTAYGPEIVSHVKNAWRRSGLPEIMVTDPRGIVEEGFYELRHIPDTLNEIAGDLTK